MASTFRIFLANSLALLYDSPDVRVLYKKYVGLMRPGIKLNEELPEFEAIRKFVVFAGQTEKKNKKKNCLKNFFKKTRGFLLWLVAVYEVFSTRSFEEFVMK